MNRTQKLKTLGFALLSVLIIAAIGVYYIASVRRSMRNQSVTDVLEVTAQGSHAFDVYAAKDAEILHSLTFIMEKEESDKQKRGRNNDRRGGSCFFCGSR